MPQKVQPNESSSSSYLYFSGSGELSRTSQYRKLIDDKNYELSTIVRVPFYKWGRGVNREKSEKSQKISDNQFKLERVVRTPDVNGKLSPFEITYEDHQLKGTTDEIQRSFYRSDVNGNMVTQSVENETIIKLSKKETQITRALYCPGIEGKLSLTVLEEGVERKISDTGSIEESTRKIKEASGRMAVVESLRQTITKLSDQSFKKETVVQRADDNGRLVLTDEVVETQTENPDGTRKYQRLLESRNINRFIGNVNSSRPMLCERVTAEEKNCLTELSKTLSR